MIVFNRPIDAALAERLHQQFIEVLLAPGFEAGALEVLTQKEAIRILEAERRALRAARARRQAGARRAAGPGRRPDRGDARDDDRGDRSRSRPRSSGTTCCSPGRSAGTCARTRSCSPRTARRVGIGAGQMSRVDSVRIAVEKARDAFGDEAAELLAGLGRRLRRVLPLRRRPAGARSTPGATAVIQPGGSKRDDEVIAACDEARRRDGLHRPPPLPPLMAARGAATLHVLRVFCAADGSGGNPLGVFLDGGEVPEAERQAVAARPRVRRDGVRRRHRARPSCGSSPRRSSCRSPATRWSARRGCCASEGTPPTALRPPAGEVAGALRRRARRSIAARARVGAAVRVRRARLAGGGRRARPGRPTATAWSASGHGSTRRAGLDPRARASSPEAGVAEDEATGSAAMRLSRGSAARSRSARAAAR